MVDRAALRRKGRTARRSLAVSHRSAAERQLTNHLMSLAFESSATVGVYLSDDGEPSLVETIEQLRARGHQVALPVPEADAVNSDSAMSFRLWSENDELITGRFGIPVPPNNGSDGVGAGSRVPDVLLVPLVAFDHHGNRLGRGAGFYDRYLARNQTSAGTRPLAIGVAFEAQRVGAIPAQPYDELLDLVVTELGIRWIRPKGTP